MKSQSVLLRVRHLMLSMTIAVISLHATGVNSPADEVELTRFFIDGKNYRYVANSALVIQLKKWEPSEDSAVHPNLNRMWKKARAVMRARLPKSLPKSGELKLSSVGCYRIFRTSLWYFGYSFEPIPGVALEKGIWDVVLLSDGSVVEAQEYELIDPFKP